MNRDNRRDSENIVDDPTPYPGYIPFFLDLVKPDTIQYKPYDYSLAPVPAVVVRIPLDSKYVLDCDPELSETITISLEGMAVLLGKIATAIEQMHADRINK